MIIFFTDSQFVSAVSFWSNDGRYDDDNEGYPVTGEV